MADFTPTIRSASRDISTAPNVTDHSTAATASNNYYFQNDGRTVLIAKAATTATVTVQTPNSVDGLAITDKTFALPDADEYVLGPFPPPTYNDSQGRLLVTVSANTSLLAVRV